MGLCSISPCSAAPTFSGSIHIHSAPEHIPPLPVVQVFANLHRFGGELNFKI